MDGIIFFFSIFNCDSVFLSPCDWLRSIDLLSMMLMWTKITIIIVLNRNWPFKAAYSAKTNANSVIYNSMESITKKKNVSINDMIGCSGKHLNAPSSKDEDMHVCVLCLHKKYACMFCVFTHIHAYLQIFAWVSYGYCVTLQKTTYPE